MGLKDWLRRLERANREDIDGFELLDGTHYYYDRGEVGKELYLYAVDATGGRHPEPPEIFRMACKAKDPAEALARIEWHLTPQNPDLAFVRPAELYDTYALVNERRLVPIR